MPEYLAPGVYVEEVSFRSKSIEGVATSTTGFAGLSRMGPVRYPGGPSSTEPRLITSYIEFEQVYGGLEPLELAGDSHIPYLAHAARMFFENGGKRLYVSRVFVPTKKELNEDDWGVASRAVAVDGPKIAYWRARWPGADGEVYVETRVVRSKNVGYKPENSTKLQARRARHGALVEAFTVADLGGGEAPKDNDPLTLARLYVVSVDNDGVQTFLQNGSPVELTDHVIQLVELQVIVKTKAGITRVYNELGADPAQKRFVGRILDRDDPEDENAMVWLDWDPASLDLARYLAIALQGVSAALRRLEGGHDGQLPTADALKGNETSPDYPEEKATGLEALGEIDDIAIVALPDAGALGADQCAAAAGVLISHAERMRYRIAIVDGPLGSSLNEIRAFRGKFDSKYAALYHPWLEIFDPSERPSQGAPPRRLLVPPSGAVAGIYGRSDIERGVHKAPANEVVRGLTKFEVNINKGRQDVLNPEGINALRFFEGRGNRVWGARTMSSDPEWKYVNVRRLFIFLEHSIDKGTQWAVFEPNNERLWANIRLTIEDFLYVQWKNGALLGSKPEDAYFVRCDRTTMTQNDIDNGRMICLIGVAPVMPAEFVIFRIGQFTANARTN